MGAVLETEMVCNLVTKMVAGSEFDFQSAFHLAQMLESHLA